MRNRKTRLNVIKRGFFAKNKSLLKFLKEVVSALAKKLKRIFLLLEAAVQRSS